MAIVRRAYVDTTPAVGVHDPKVEHVLADLKAERYDQKAATLTEPLAYLVPDRRGLGHRRRAIWLARYFKVRYGRGFDPFASGVRSVSASPSCVRCRVMGRGDRRRVRWARDRQRKKKGREKAQAAPAGKPAQRRRRSTKSAG